MSGFAHGLKRFWKFLKQDTWQSWLVSLVLAFVFIKLIFFPFLSWIFATPLPLVVVESCSMYHPDNFDSWWDRNEAWYGSHGINREEFEDFRFTNGLSKGDIILVSGRGEYNQGDVLIFIFNATYSAWCQPLDCNCPDCDYCYCSCECNCCRSFSIHQE